MMGWGGGGGGGNYCGFDLCFYFSVILLLACNMGWGEGDSHGCGRPVVLSLNVLMFCLYQGSTFPGAYAPRLSCGPLGFLG